MVDAIPDTWPSRKYGIRLMAASFMKHLHPMPYEEAVYMAAKLAADLRAKGVRRQQRHSRENTAI